MEAPESYSVHQSACGGELAGCALAWTLVLKMAGATQVGHQR